MVPTTLTPEAIFTAAGSTVSQFGGLILLVVGIGMGIWGVKFVIKRVKGAK